MKNSRRNIIRLQAAALDKAIAYFRNNDLMYRSREKDDPEWLIQQRNWWEKAIGKATGASVYKKAAILQAIVRSQGEALRPWRRLPGTPGANKKSRYVCQDNVKYTMPYFDSKDAVAAALGIPMPKLVAEARGY